MHPHIIHNTFRSESESQNAMNDHSSMDREGVVLQIYVHGGDGQSASDRSMYGWSDLIVVVSVLVIVALWAVMGGSERFTRRRVDLCTVDRICEASYIGAATSDLVAELDLCIVDATYWVMQGFYIWE